MADTTSGGQTNYQGRGSNSGRGSGRGRGNSYGSGQGCGINSMKPNVRGNFEGIER